MANASDSIFQSGASDVYISQKKEISAPEKYLYVGIVKNLKIACPLEEVPFVYPSNVTPFLESFFLKSSRRKSISLYQISNYNPQKDNFRKLIFVLTKDIFGVL